MHVIAAVALFTLAPAVAAACPANYTALSIGTGLSVCEPAYCDAHTCPSSLGKCDGSPGAGGTCSPTLPGYRGMATTPVGAITGYCNASDPWNCRGIWTPSCGSAEGFLDCARRVLGAPDVAGIAAVNPALFGGHLPPPSGQQGLSVHSGLCYMVSTEGLAAPVKIAVTDQCGGFCTCKNYPKYNAKDALACFAECGGAAQEIAPACPAIGVLGTSGPTFNGRNYGTATSCCGAPSPHCANTHFDERQHGDWCASSNHVHFDLDYDSAAVLCGTDKPNNCIITKLEPVRCAPART